jgi:eukaryotic-like serine/threonine-protein kinase
MDERQDSLIGGQFGDYRILSPLGSGGMGMVYAAEDTRLRRKVAIKFLAAELLGDERSKQRLFHEAWAAAALDHPNICTVYDVDEAHGQAFIVMQIVEGETLATRLTRGPIPLEQTLDIATQAAEALSAAHERGIVHRDIKPQNIIVSDRGQVKVLDFGVAKMAPRVDDQTVTASGLRTIDGAVAGTVPYMSPEQIRGETLDGRSDLFSLGIVLHELVNGTRPFAGAGSADTLAAILTKDPPPFKGPAGAPTSELERIALKCLEKDRDLRYQSARELLADLRRLRRESSATAAAPRTVSSGTQPSARRYVLAAAGLIVAVASGAAAWRWSTTSSEEIGAVAVLPLTHVNVAPALDYQAETITGGLIDGLSRLPALKVMSRTAVQRYQGRATDAQTVGRELGVDAVVTGRLVGNGDALTLDLEIVNADDNSHIWGKQYQLTSANLLAVQREIPADLSEALRPSTRTSTNNAQRSTTDPEANRLYWLGRQSYYRFSQEGTKLAVEYFMKAIARDPNYALAYSGLAQAYMVGSGGGFPRSEATRLGRAAALRAIELDPNLSEAHSALALVLGDDWDFAGVDREFRRAIELNPNNVEAHHNYSHFLLGFGRTDEAFAEARKVEEFDPVTNLALAHYAYCYLVVRQFDRSIEYFKRYVSSTSDPGSHLQLADAFYEKGMFKEAFDAFLTGHKLNGLTGAELDAMGDAYAKRGMPGYFRARIAILEARGQAEPNLYPMASLGGQLASLYARLGDKDRAFQLLERMYNERDGACLSVREEVSFHVLHSDARFADLLRRIGLPPV